MTLPDGLATAVVVGLDAATPAAGVVAPLSAILIGAIAAVPCYLVIAWRASVGLDDSLDVFRAHGVGGVTGALLIPVSSSPRAAHVVAGATTRGRT